jgi:signal transduction histidine kinase
VAEREFYQPIPVRGRDEVADLTQAFNQMAAKLRELDDLKEQFFSSISHELRTPLTAINMAANMLHEGLPGPLTPKQARLVEITQVSSNRLLRLVNQILDLGSLKAGKLRLDLRQTDLRRVVETAVEEVRPLAEDGKLQLEVSIPENIPKIMADEERLTQVLLNLLGNSVKFTRSGGTITVGVQIEAGQAVVKVTDTGVGIAPDLVPKIFDRYEQVHKGRGGTGIGLALVKGFVEAHGGKVWVESEEGRGSCFAFSIPVEGRS